MGPPGREGRGTPTQNDGKTLLANGGNADMRSEHDRVCPVERAGALDAGFRRWLQNPRRILAPCVREGMVALDVGCGPGFFTLPMAEMVGTTGRVFAVDLQEGMLEKLRDKIIGTPLEDRIVLRKCTEDSLGVTEPVDFVLLFYMVHEVPDKDGFFRQIAGVLKPTGSVLVVEPPVHVSKSAFETTLRIAEAAGLRRSQGPRVTLSKTAILQKG